MADLWTDHSDPPEEPANDWQQAWDAMAEIPGDEEPAPPQPPDRPDHPDLYRAAFDDDASWEPWEWDPIHSEAAIRALLPRVTYGPGRAVQAGKALDRARLLREDV